jgi:cyclase
MDHVVKTVRVIPRLDIKGPNLVKGIHLEGLRVLGKPWDFANRYYQEGADELIYIDAVASLYGRNNLLEIVKRTAENIFIPLTVGGGIRSLDDIRDLLRAGADKVAINTAAVGDPGLIARAAQSFGSQCIVGSIQAKLNNGKYEVYTDNGRERTDREVLPWAKQLVELGAGELLVTSVDREGTGTGYDLRLIGDIARAVPVPVIACGGCGNAEHLAEAVQDGSADAVCASSLFHYHYVDELISDMEYREEGNVEFLKNTRGGLGFMRSRLTPMSIPAAKDFLRSRRISCRETVGRHHA